uniref:CRS2 n=1 Tax=Arundo donax TaxID=35708 RepID=A0A0A9GKU2_ARUDO
MYDCGFTSKTGTSPIEPTLSSDLDWIVFIVIPSSRAMRSTISNPTLCRVP